MTTANVKTRPRPFLFPHLCKACGRCIEACPKHCIELGTEIDPVTGFTPVTVNLDACNGCGLCISACPEPHGLMPMPPELEGVDMVVSDPFSYFGPRARTRPAPESIADRQLVHGRNHRATLARHHQRRGTHVQRKSLPERILLRGRQGIDQRPRTGVGPEIAAVHLEDQTPLEP